MSGASTVLCSTQQELMLPGFKQEELLRTKSFVALFGVFAAVLSKTDQKTDIALFLFSTKIPMIALKNSYTTKLTNQPNNKNPKTLRPVVL